MQLAVASPSRLSAPKTARCMALLSHFHVLECLHHGGWGLHR